MAITNDHFTGFIFGVGATAAAYYYYRKNRPQVDDFLRRQGIELPNLNTGRDISSLSMEELIREKERFEDMIAEREGAPARHPEPDPESQPVETAASQ